MIGGQRRADGGAPRPCGSPDDAEQDAHEKRDEAAIDTPDEAAVAKIVRWASSDLIGLGSLVDRKPLRGTMSES